MALLGGACMPAGVSEAGSQPTSSRLQPLCRLASGECARRPIVQASFCPMGSRCASPSGAVGRWGTGEGRRAPLHSSPVPQCQTAPAGRERLGAERDKTQLVASLHACNVAHAKGRLRGPLPQWVPQGTERSAALSAPLRCMRLPRQHARPPLVTQGASLLTPHHALPRVTAAHTTKAASLLTLGTLPHEGEGTGHERGRRALGCNRGPLKAATPTALGFARSLAPQQPASVICRSSDAQHNAVLVAVEGGGAGEGEADTGKGGTPEAAGGGEAGEEELTSLQLLWRVVKPPLYSVAFIPLLVGAAAAYLQYGTFHPGRFWSFLFHSVLIIAWLNMSNDAFDAETGVDKYKKESVVNITGSRVGVLLAAFTLLAFGLSGLLKGALAVGDMRVFQLLAAAIACGYIYQSPPFRLSYKGLGEPLCFVAFGPLATTAFYLYQASSPGVLAVVGPTVLAASILVGITTTLILFCSHFHQIESDLSVGKMSPLVRLGTEVASHVFRSAILFLYGAAVGFCATGVLPLACMPCLLATTPVAAAAIRFVETHHMDKSTIFMAKYVCTRLHIAFGVMLALGLGLGRTPLPWSL